ncbi:MAG: hypothetical protein LPL29_14145, partial [Alphaproteobacteria bacterium]|nr:hypothetical protein [Alphaproteobacteria bacterium]MDX5370509.1 hypothetical protein [Alphaproteobacteria bacterium]
ALRAAYRAHLTARMRALPFSAAERAALAVVIDRQAGRRVVGRLKLLRRGVKERLGLYQRRAR